MKIRKLKWNEWAVVTLLLTLSFFVVLMDSKEVPENETEADGVVVRSGTSNDAPTIQKAIDQSVSNGTGVVTLAPNQTYRLQSGIVIKPKVELRMGAGTKLVVDGNFRAITLQKDAAIINGTIEVINKGFKSEVVFVRGTDTYDASNETRMDNVRIVNLSKTYGGTGLSLYAKGTWENISFVNFTNLTVSGFNVGVQLRSVRPDDGKTYSWVNANRFVNFSMEDCVTFIDVAGSRTIPNENSGNLFLGLQIQPTERTVRILRVDGMYNKFEGMVWDLHRIKHQNAIVNFSKNSESNRLEIMNIPAKRVSNLGDANVIR